MFYLELWSSLKSQSDLEPPTLFQCSGPGTKLRVLSIPGAQKVESGTKGSFLMFIDLVRMILTASLKFDFPFSLHFPILFFYPFFKFQKE